MYQLCPKIFEVKFQNPLSSLRGPCRTVNTNGEMTLVERITDRKGRVGFFLLGEQVEGIPARSKHNTAALSKRLENHPKT